MPTETSVFANDVRPSLTPVGQVDVMTINWHVTEACNYRCQYCYAHWKDRPDPRELFHDFGRSRDLLERLLLFFHPENTANPLRQRLNWKAVRLNIAGGEPSILNGRLINLAKVARDIGFQLSIISNGSRLSRDVIERLAPHLTCLGISLDSANSITNRDIGRIDRQGRLPDIAGLIANLQIARSITPEITIKLNTVVNRLNAYEDLSRLVDQIKPDRWKILRMLPVTNQSLAISDDQFSAFVFRHRSYESIQCVEDHSDMSESYLMVDPFGRFFQNQHLLIGDGYVYSQPILLVGPEVAFAELRFNSDSFSSRYTRITVEGIV